MIASTHKIVGSLTQSAMLLVGEGDRVDIEAVARAVRLVRSTSPSSLLMASLDAARRQLAVHGEALLDRTILAAAPGAGGDRRRSPGARCSTPARVGRPGIAGWDPLRIVIDVRGTGCTGYEVAAALRASYDIFVELATHATLVLVRRARPAAGGARADGHDFAETVRRDRPVRTGTVAVTPALGGRRQHETVVTPREAFLGAGEAVPVDAAVGRISCESIAGYPPGVPALLPGERMTAEVLAYLRELIAAGARLHGAADPELATVRVLA